MSAARILVVDDESEIRGLLKEILADEGYEVDVAADASEARAERLENANKEVSRRLVTAMETIRAVLDR